ncbi:MAG: hypothetical protein J7J82_02200 [Staphylothermus sp.]|nr:hypothetical protein [Staphylothermus sp.]
MSESLCSLVPDTTYRSMLTKGYFVTKRPDRRPTKEPKTMYLTHLVKATISTDEYIPYIITIREQITTITLNINEYLPRKPTIPITKRSFLIEYTKTIMNKTSRKSGVIMCITTSFKKPISIKTKARKSTVFTGVYPK